LGDRTAKQVILGPPLWANGWNGKNGILLAHRRVKPVAVSLANADRVKHLLARACR
jgi:hypothetical protein